jgi:hypothetical protein
MSQIRISIYLNLADDAEKYEESLHEAIAILTEQIENAVVKSDAIECEAFGDPIIDGMDISRRVQIWEDYPL